MRVGDWSDDRDHPTSAVCDIIVTAQSERQ